MYIRRQLSIVLTIFPLVGLILTHWLLFSFERVRVSERMRQRVGKEWGRNGKRGEEGRGKRERERVRDRQKDRQTDREKQRESELERQRE